MKNQKGFSMVELLAVIVIIGILSIVTIGSVTKLVEKAKKNQVEQQEESIRMATESFAQANRNYLPKTVGGKKRVPLQELLDSKYITEPIKDSGGRSCMAESYVEIYKSSKTKYTYTPYLICGDTEGSESIKEITKPTGEITYVPTSSHVQIKLDAGNTLSGTAMKFQNYSVTVKSKSTGSVLYQSVSDTNEKVIQLTIALSQLTPPPASIDEIIVNADATTTSGEKVSIQK